MDLIQEMKLKQDQESILDLDMGHKFTTHLHQKFTPKICKKTIFKKSC